MARTKNDLKNMFQEKGISEMWFPWYDNVSVAEVVAHIIWRGKLYSLFDDPITEEKRVIEIADILKEA